MIINDHLSFMKLLIFVVNHESCSSSFGFWGKKLVPSQRLKTSPEKKTHRSHKCNSDQPSVMEEFLVLLPAGEVAACG